ncbi:MAG TPA: FixH family protein [Candidatus Sulfotelmatobacter sp.]|jgi:nitrogen fixation protein FixH|nr:FixH family protein [Candidatus Sulfotelmatobacter sp.]
MNTTTSRRPGWWYPYIFVGVFLVVLAVNLVMASSAVRTFTGLQTEQAYDKGLAYNQVLAQAKEQEKLGWTVDAQVVPHDPSNAQRHDADVTVSYLDKAGQPVKGLSVQAEIVRPTQAGHDLKVDLVEKTAGQYVALAPLDMPGQWEISVIARLGETQYKFSQRVLVP